MSAMEGGTVVQKLSSVRIFFKFFFDLMCFICAKKITFRNCGEDEITWNMYR